MFTLVDHRGVPNFILQEEDKFLASVYNNKSIAEQNSVDLAWNTLMEPEFEALRCTIFCDIGELKRFRQLLVNCKCLMSHLEHAPKASVFCGH